MVTSINSPLKFKSKNRRVINFSVLFDLFGELTVYQSVSNLLEINSKFPRNEFIEPTL